MGHLGNIKEIYRNLNRHINHHQTGFPDSPEAYQILKILYSPEDAALALKLPLKPVKLKTLARRLNENPDELRLRLDAMADRGLVFDVVRQDTGEYYYMLAPPIVGFMEMSFMRVRQDIPQKELAHLLHEGLHKSDDFAEAIFGGTTHIGRTLVHEQQVPENYSDILPYEKATSLIEESGGGAVSLCYCRHIAQHEGSVCDNPLEICMSLYEGADFVLRHHFGRPAEKSELLELLAEAREKGLVQICDNIQRKPTYICNCCGCCCGQLMAINTWGLSDAVHTSNFIAAIGSEDCTGCGRCARRCPIGAIRLEAKPPFSARKHELKGVIDEEICLGCGVCVPACKKEVLRMKPRQTRVMTPELTLERVLRMNLERGTLPFILFDDPESWQHRWIGTLVSAIMKLPPVKWALLQDKIQSRYISQVMTAAKKTMPGLAEQL